MKWLEVIPALRDYLLTDSELVGLLGGGFIYRAKATTKIQIPGIYYSVVSEAILENTAPFRVQWDIWASSDEIAGKIELRLYKLMHRDGISNIAGFTMLSQYAGSTLVDENTQGTVHRAVEFVYAPARDNE